MSYIKIILFAINVAVLAYGIWKYDLSDLTYAYHNVLTKNGLKALVVMVFFQVSLILVQVIRLKKLSGDSFAKSYRIYIAGAAANAILPMRLGEGHRAISTAAISADRLKKHFIAIVYERCVDLYYIGALVILNLYIAYFTPTPRELIGVLLMLCFLFAISLNPIGLTAEWLLTSFVKNSKYKKTVLDLLLPIANGTRGDMQVFNVIILLINICIPAIGISVYFNTFDNALNAGVEVIVATIVLMAIPVTPGAVGVFEIAISSLLSKTLSVDIESALAFTILYHFAILMPQIIMFIFELITTTSFNAIRKGRKG